MATSTSHVRSTIFVRNLPFSAKKEDLESLFENFGPIKQCFVVTDKGVKERCRGFGYITFALRDDAESAIKSSKTFQGRKLMLDFADRKPKKVSPRDNIAAWSMGAGSGESGKSKKDDGETAKQSTPPKKAKVTKETKEPAQIKTKKESKRKKKKVKEDIKNQEAEREKRKCRLIVRNLPFKCSEETLKSTFEAFGAVSEVSLPVNKKSSKKLGFGFVQFEALKKAAKALKHMNGKEIMGRVVAVDWTLPRAEYLEAMKKVTTVSSKDEDDEGEESGDADEQVDEDDDVEGADDQEDDQEDDEEMDESEDGGSEDEVEDDDDMEDDDEDMEEDEDDDDDEEEEDEPMDDEKAKPKKHLEDVQEGKTLFIRNVPYESTDDDVRKIFAPFGDLEVCRVVMDHMTEHSRGTAFVKFKRMEDAEICLQEGDALRLSGRLLAVSPAISRSEAVRLRQVEKEKVKEEQKDKRNLHLLREGLIRPGTKSAEGLSEAYLNKRMKVEALKKDKLRNLNIFVSPTRLAVHNLPKAVDDKRLKELAREGAGDKKAKVTEARIMRDLQNPTAGGTCKSLGFGFVAFSQHEHALNALLHINNNPDLFGPEKRPIVGFSLENKKALEIQQKRREKAKMKQEMFSKQDRPKAAEESQQQRKPYSQQQKQISQQKKPGNEMQPPRGATATMVMPQDGQKKGLPRHFGAKNRWRDRGKVADEKRRRQKEKRLVLQKQVWSSMKDPATPGSLGVTKKELRKEKQKNRKKKQPGRDVREDKQFNAMVNKYKQKLTRTSDQGGKKGTSKWFDT